MLFDIHPVQFAGRDLFESSRKRKYTLTAREKERIMHSGVLSLTDCLSCQDVLCAETWSGQLILVGCSLSPGTESPTNDG